jgi:hypothetical protein
MAFYKSGGHAAIPSAWVTMGILYFAFMMFGVFTVRVPAEGWKPPGWSFWCDAVLRSSLWQFTFIQWCPVAKSIRQR